MKKTIAISLISILATSTFISCREEKKDNTGLLAAAALLLNRSSGSSRSVSGTTIQQRQVSTARSSASAAASSARSSAGASGAFNVETPALKQLEQKLALIQESNRLVKTKNFKGLKKFHENRMAFLAKKTGPIATATCTGTACSGAAGSFVLTGTDACAAGSVNRTLNSLAGTIAYSGTAGNADNMTVTMNSGTVTFPANCQVSTLSFQNFPLSTNQPITGTVTPTGSYSLSNSMSGTVSTNRIVENLRAVGSNLTMGTTTISSMDVTSVTDYSIVDDFANISYTTNAGGSVKYTDIDQVYCLAQGFSLIGSSGCSVDSTMSAAYNSTTNRYGTVTGNIGSVSRATLATNWNNYQDATGISYTSVVNGKLNISGTVSGASASFSDSFTNKNVTTKYTCTKTLQTLTFEEYDTLCTFTIN